MTKRILIPTDFSKNALNAARFALDLYLNQQCEFYFLHVFHPRNFTTSKLFIPEVGSEEYETAKSKAENGMKKFIEMLKLHGSSSNKTFVTIIEFNYLSESMKNLIAKKDIDLVVMGTQGATSSKGIIFGSNTVLTMEKIRECPILAVPADYQFTTLKELVFPTDFKDVFKRKELQYLMEIAKWHNAAVSVLHVSKKDASLNTKQKDNKILLQEILGDLNHSFHTLTNNSVAEGLTAFVESRKSDMIAFINRKHFFFGSVFSKPLVKEIGYDTTVPILALH